MAIISQPNPKILLTRRIIAWIPLYALSTFVVNPFLAFTTVFPIILLTEGNSLRSLYTSTLGFLLNFFTGSTLENATTADAMTVFFAFTVILSILINLTERLFKYLGFKLNIGWKHAVVVMTVVYGFTWFLKRTEGELFILTFYLFNVYSIFSFHILKISFEKLRASTAS